MELGADQTLDLLYSSLAKLAEEVRLPLLESIARLSWLSCPGLGLACCRSPVASRPQSQRLSVWFDAISLRYVCLMSWLLLLILVQVIKVVIEEVEVLELCPHLEPIFNLATV